MSTSVKFEAASLDDGESSRTRAAANAASPVCTCVHEHTSVTTRAAEVNAVTPDLCVT